MRPARWLAVAALPALLAPVAAAEEAPETGWSDTAELSAVATGGNSETTTLGFKNVLRWRGERAEARIETGGLRAESVSRTRTAVGTPDRFSVDERSIRETSAERYHLRGRYDRQISSRLFWFVRSGWERNELAGYRSRVTVAAGVGHTWWDREGARFRTDYALTWTRQDDVVEAPGSQRSFAGLRLAAEYERRLTATAVYGSALAVDQNLDRSEDLRLELTQALKVSVSERLALQVGLEALYDNLPSVERLELRDPLGEPTGETVLVPLDELDTALTVALVVDF